MNYTEEQSKKLKNYRQLNEIAQKGSVLFTGSSLMEQFPVCEMCVSAGIMKPVYNRGIGGFTSQNFLDNIDVQLLDLEPSKVFINIGTNDLKLVSGEHWLENLVANYRLILRKCKEKLPETQVYLMAYYPVNDHLELQPDEDPARFAVRTNKNLARANSEVDKLAGEFGYYFINVNQGLTDEDGSLKKEYTVEGIHMFPDGYKQVFQNLHPFI